MKKVFILRRENGAPGAVYRVDDLDKIGEVAGKAKMLWQAEKGLQQGFQYCSDFVEYALKEAGYKSENTFSYLSF